MSVNNRLNMDASVSDLPGSVWIKAREVLDTNPAPRNWRALIGTLETSNMIKQRYKITGKGKSSEPPRSFFTSAQNANVCYCYATQAEES
ncbi:hypothetical protein MAR_023008 [Mya arenaria]|uniref:Uncharacterized protein n=1 Tax=Mya arenaria TaxID=6604 RepID=A0ABY7DQN0_MYAAR|nr:hypothetical protein MAR_023008 [Mya arenaria]